MADIDMTGRLHVDSSELDDAIYKVEKLERRLNRLDKIDAGLQKWSPYIDLTGNYSLDERRDAVGARARDVAAERARIANARQLRSGLTFDGRTMLAGQSLQEAMIAGHNAQQTLLNDPINKVNAILNRDKIHTGLAGQSLREAMIAGDEAVARLKEEREAAAHRFDGAGRIYKAGVHAVTGAFSAYGSYGSSVAGAIGGIDWLNPFGMMQANSQIASAGYGLMGQAGSGIMGVGGALMGIPGGQLAGGIGMAIGGGLNIAGSMGQMNQAVYQGAISTVGNLGKAIATVLTTSINLASRAIHGFANMVRGAISGLTHLIGMGAGLAVGGIAGVMGITKGITGAVNDPLRQWTGISLAEQARLESMDMAFGMAKGSGYQSQIASQNRAAQFRTMGKFGHQYEAALTGMIDYAILDSDINSRIRAVRNSMANVQGNEQARNNMYMMLSELGFGYEMQAANAMSEYGVGGMYYTHPRQAQIEAERMRTRGRVMQLGEVNKSTLSGLALDLYNNYGVGNLHVAGTRAFAAFGEGVHTGDFAPALFSAAAVLKEAGGMLLKFAGGIGKGFDGLFPNFKPYEKLQGLGGWFKTLGGLAFEAVTGPGGQEGAAKWGNVIDHVGGGISNILGGINGLFTGVADSGFFAALKEKFGKAFKAGGVMDNFSEWFSDKGSKVRGFLTGAVQDGTVDDVVGVAANIAHTILVTVRPAIEYLGDAILGMVNRTVGYIKLQLIPFQSVNTVFGEFRQERMGSVEQREAIKALGGLIEPSGIALASQYKYFNSDAYWNTNLGSDRDRLFASADKVGALFPEMRPNDLKRFMGYMHSKGDSNFQTALGLLEGIGKNPTVESLDRLIKTLEELQAKAGFAPLANRPGYWGREPDTSAGPAKKPEWINELGTDLQKFVTDLRNSLKDMGMTVKIESDDGTRTVSTEVMNNLMGAYGKVFAR